MRRSGKGAAAMIAAAGLVLASVAPGAAATTVKPGQKPTPIASAVRVHHAYPKTWLTTWTNAPTYYAGNVRAGTLYAGSNYFYCQAVGSEVTLDGYRNHWWALTDDDTGNRNVWVNDVYISTGANDQPVPGLRWC